MTLRTGIVGSDGEVHANARLLAAAPDLYEAARLLEAAEDANANCEECGGQGVPELCGSCFPLFDDARVTRRLALAKVDGGIHSRAKALATKTGTLDRSMSLKLQLHAEIADALEEEGMTPEQASAEALQKMRELDKYLNAKSEPA